MISSVVCLTTVGSRSVAEKIGRRLVAERTAACVNVVPRLVSFYHWKGKLCRDRESLLVIKTTSAKVKKLERLLHQIHPYDLPEFVVLSMRGGSQRYLDWIRKSVKSTSKNCPSALLPSRQRSSRTSQVRSGLWLAGA